MSIAASPERFDTTVETLIVGAGACGLVAALAAREAGQSVLVLERDAVPAGSTALSAGLIPGAGTAQQAACGVADSAALFAQDIQSKAGSENDPAHVKTLADASGPAIDWLTSAHGVPLTLVTDFDYPGHSRRRMHGVPSRAGRDLINVLRSRAEALEIDIICDRHVPTLFARNDRITGAQADRPDGGADLVGCARLILASNGFGGNRDMVRAHMPEIAEALWFGHGGNQGDAVLWGQALGADVSHMGAFQGHGNVAHPHGVLISWAVITQGGVQINSDGKRFWDESQGYSEAARAVLEQPGGIAWTIFDTRIATIARQFADFQAAEACGAILTADTLGGLAAKMGVPADPLAQNLAAHCPFGRDFSGCQPLAPPYCAVRVTGALFHTQGGLRVDGRARVVKSCGTALPNLYAGGGAAVGVSGAGDAGYLSGNGLLAAVVLGRIAGEDWPDPQKDLD